MATLVHCQWVQDGSYVSFSNNFFASRWRAIGDELEAIGMSLSYNNYVRTSVFCMELPKSCNSERVTYSQLGFHLKPHLKI